MEGKEIREKLVKAYDEWIHRAFGFDTLFEGYVYPGIALNVCIMLKQQLSVLSDKELEAWADTDIDKSILMRCKEYEENMTLEDAKQRLREIGIPEDLCECIPPKDCMRSKEYLSNLYIVQHPETMQAYKEFRDAHAGLSEVELNDEFAKLKESEKRDDFEIFKDGRQDYILEMKERLADTVLPYDDYLLLARSYAGEEKYHMVYKDDLDYCAWCMMKSEEWKDILEEWKSKWTDSGAFEVKKEEYLSFCYGEERDKSKDAMHLDACLQDLPASTRQELEAKNPPKHYIQLYAMELDMKRRRKEAEEKEEADAQKAKEKVEAEKKELYALIDESIALEAVMGVPRGLARFSLRAKTSGRRAAAMQADIDNYIMNEYGFDIENPQELSDFIASHPEKLPTIKRAIEQYNLKLKSVKEQIDVEHERHEAKQAAQAALNQERSTSRAAQNDYNFSRNDNSNRNNGNRYNRNDNDNRYNRNGNRLFDNRYNRSAQNGEMPTLQMAASVILGMAAIILMLLAIIIHAWYLLIPALSILAAVIVGHVTKKMYLAAIIAIVPTFLLLAVMSRF